MILNTIAHSKAKIAQNFGLKSAGNRVKDLFHLKRIVLQNYRQRNENLIFLFLNKNIYCGYSKEPSQ